MGAGYIYIELLIVLLIATIPPIVIFKYVFRYLGKEVGFWKLVLAFIIGVLLLWIFFIFAANPNGGFNIIRSIIGCILYFVLMTIILKRLLKISYLQGALLVIIWPALAYGIAAGIFTSNIFYFGPPT